MLNTMSSIDLPSLRMISIGDHCCLYSSIIVENLPSLEDIRIGKKCFVFSDGEGNFVRMDI